MDRDVSVICDLITRLAQFQFNSELNHITLCQELLFQAEVAFYRLDQSDRKSISANEILDFLLDNKKEIIQQESLFNFIASNDKDMDGVLNYFERFLNYILPKSQPVLQQNVLKRDSYFIRKQMFLPQVIEEKLSEVIYFDIVGLQMIDQMRRMALKKIKVTPHKIFQMIDLDNLEYFTIGQLDIFLQQNGINLHVYELFIFFNTADVNEDGKIDYEEFISCIFGQTQNNQKQKSTKKLSIYSTPEKTSEVNDEMKQIYYQQLMRLLDEQLQLSNLFSKAKGQNDNVFLQSTFRTINNNQPITLMMLYNYTNQNGMMNINDLTLLFEKYDIDKDGMLNEAEFLSIFKIIESNNNEQSSSELFTKILQMKIMMDKGQNQIEELVRLIKQVDPNFINDMAPLIKDIKMNQNLFEQKQKNIE